MSKPNILKAMDELDYAGYYGGTTNLGTYDSAHPNLLDDVLHNGTYSFIGGIDTPIVQDPNNTAIWILTVRGCDDSSRSIQEVEKVPESKDDINIIELIRYRVDDTWTAFVDTVQVIQGVVNDVEERLKKHMLGGI